MGLESGVNVTQEKVAEVAVGRAMNLQREVIMLEAALQDTLGEVQSLQGQVAAAEAKLAESTVEVTDE